MNLKSCKKLLYKILVTVWLLLPAFLCAEDIVLMANNMSPLLLNLKSKLEQQSQDFTVTIVTQDRPSTFPNSSYIVSVGSHSVNPLFREKAKGVISILVTEKQNRGISNQSAIYVEPPFERQLRLTQEVFPNSKIGVLVADQKQKELIEKALTPLQSPLLNVVKLTDSNNLNVALFDVLKDSDVLLGVYDKRIYNSENIKNILITSYRQQKVLVGPSKAYLKAGSFISTYSNLSHIAERLTDIISTYDSEGRWLDEGYNPYYEIVLNSQVGNSLNILLPDLNLLTKKMKGVE
jgi:hypothetical protein